jgi:ABC-type antimicrobial peptide transport system permease subunit
VTGPEGAPIGVLPVVVAGCVVGMFLAVIGAAGPALRAAKMPPVEAMRVEV